MVGGGAVGRSGRHFLVAAAIAVIGACGGISGDDQPSSTNPTTVPAPSTEPPITEPEQEPCSADGFAVPVDDQGQLPRPVADVRDALVAHAGSCDFDGLAERALADVTSFSFGGDTDPAGFWRDLETSGDTPMAAMLTVLHMSPGTLEVAGELYYVWPAVAALDDWSQATEEQRRELEARFGSEAVTGWDQFGAYVGYRVGITEDGRWSFFVAGD